MNVYKYLLLATDLSDASEAAARRAADLVKRYRARFSTLHVVEHFPGAMPMDQILPENVDMKAFLRNRGRDELAKDARRLGLERIEQYVMVSTRSARYEIVRFAKEQGVDLIVVGTHSRHGIMGLFGSTAMGVLHDASCDVLTVRSQP
ncbi:MAG: universal stress protein [Acidiferrobacterales bacterium]